MDQAAQIYQQYDVSVKQAVEHLFEDYHVPVGPVSHQITTGIHGWWKRKGKGRDTTVTYDAVLVEGAIQIALNTLLCMISNSKFFY